LQVELARRGQVGGGIRAVGRSRGQHLTIGIVNLMPASAMRRTEHEFRALLQGGSQTCALRCFTPTPHDLAMAEPLDSLWGSRLDGLIVTGAEPKADVMEDEPLLPLLRQLTAWGAEQTKSVIFSCFAAHAAVWCLDQIPRERFPEKLSGVFACQKAADHPVTAQLPDQWVTPHSRYNTLDERAVRDAGYLVLSRALRLGPDMFVKPCGNSEFLFVQGHPEYGTEVLLSEYRRDVKRHESGGLAQAPHWPENYSETEHAWRDPALRMMRGWTSLLGASRPLIGVA
jgi:homoserine O-succinyltransferase